MQEDKYISGEEYQRQRQQSQPPHKDTAPIIWIVAAVIVIASLGFFGYIHFKHHAANTNNAGSTTANTGTYGTSGGGQSSSGLPAGTTIGTVTASSATSITVRPSSGGGTETFSVASYTMMQTSSSGAPGAYNPADVHVGQTVTIIPGPSGTSGATMAINVLLFAQTSSPTSSQSPTAPMTSPN